MNYLDFELEITHISGREYHVVVIRSAAGEAREIMRFPFDEVTLESRLKDLLCYPPLSRQKSTKFKSELSHTANGCAS